MITMDDNNTRDNYIVWFTTCIVISLTLMSITSPGVAASVDVHVETILVPNNQVQVGAVFAIHCQVWNLKEGQRVEIFQIADSRSYPLSVGLSVVQEVDERVLLAIRHMSDGSVVYFLTVMDVSVHDEATYACKVIDTFPELVEVTSGTVNLRLMYFPSVTDPVCSALSADDSVVGDYTASSSVTEGDIVTFSCHSSPGNPDVSIAWLTQGSKPNFTQTKQDGRVYATMRMKIKANYHHGAIFVCQITSQAFPGLKQTCHIGPLNVIRDPNSPPALEETLSPFKPAEVLTSPSVKPHDVTDKDLSVKDCQNTCNLMNTNSPVIYWIITTLITSVLAMIFLIIGVTLMVKLCRFSSDNYENSYDYHEPGLRLQQDPSTRFYREVTDSTSSRQRDGGGNKMYMSLLKPYPIDSDISSQVSEKLQLRT